MTDKYLSGEDELNEKCPRGKSKAEIRIKTTRQTLTDIDIECCGALMLLAKKLC